MNFKLVSKNNMSVVVTLILVVLLSQSRFFDFLTDTILGRILILMIIIFISHTNKFLGLLAVLFIMIAFEQHNKNIVQSYNFYEGFDVSGNTSDISGNQIASAIMNDKISIMQSKEDILKQQLSALTNQSNTSGTTSTSTTTSNVPTSNVPTSTGNTSTSLGAREGFCMTDRESNILRGKQSNSIPVFNNTRDQDDSISPTDKSVFSNIYFSF
jgi:predicted lactoylglutathione lyase